MDGLQSSLKNINLYDIKAAVRKAQNVVMNYTSTEAKVREATNNEPWGASTSLMMEIAQGTHNYSQLNEIMPMVYRRFTEKTAEEWRQIYKALQLLEFLVKNGSERVIDDARAHQATIKMLRNFHYIDRYQRDQGLNVRTRAKELVELLNDNDRIRQERRKARQTRGKYFGVGSDGDARLSSGSRPRYSGFGSSPHATGFRNNRVYGDGGGFSDVGSGSGFHDSSSYSDTHDHSEYDEYNENYDSAVPSARTSRLSARTTRNSQPSAAPVSSPPKREQQSAVADLLGLEEPATPAPTSSTIPNYANTVEDDDGFGEFQTSSAAPTAPATSANDDDDAFDDFQSAPSAVPPSGGIGNMASFSSFASSSASPSLGNVASLNVNTPTAVGLSPQNYASTTQTTHSAKAVKGSGSGSDAFGSLWSSAVTRVKHDDHSKTGSNSPSVPPVSTSSNPPTSDLLSSDDNNLLL